MQSVDQGVRDYLLDNLPDVLDFDDQTDMSEDEREKAREIASMFFACFNTDPGQYVLKRLVEITLAKPVILGHSTQFEAGIREGQNKLVLEILQNIELAKIM